MLLPGPPADHPQRLTGERFAVAPAFERASCYYWRVSPNHHATDNTNWKIRHGDLMLLDTSIEVTSNLAGIKGKMCVIDGQRLQMSDPAYGLIEHDDKDRLVFFQDESRLRFNAPPIPRNDNTQTEPIPKHAKRKRTIRTQEAMDQRAAKIASDPWFSLPWFALSDILAVQAMMVRI